LSAVAVMYQRILVPVDGSETAQLGLAEAVKLASALKSRLRLVHIVDELPAVSPQLFGAVYEGIYDKLREGGQAILAKAEDTVRTADVPAETQLVEALGGIAGEYIVREANAWSADLIVSGTHGRRGLRRIVMGSDAEFVVRHSPVPVLLVRPQQ